MIADRYVRLHQNLTILMGVPMLLHRFHLIVHILDSLGILLLTRVLIDHPLRVSMFPLFMGQLILCNLDHRISLSFHILFPIHLISYSLFYPYHILKIITMSDYDNS